MEFVPLKSIDRASRISRPERSEKSTAFESFVYAPLGCETLAIAAGRAGARGCLSIDQDVDPARIEAACARLADPVRGAKAPFGLRLPRLNAALAEMIVKWSPEGLSWVILPQDEITRCLETADVALFSHVSVIVEVTGRQAAPWPEEVAGVMVKGNEAPGRVGEETSFILFQHWITETSEAGLPLYVHGGVTPQVAAAIAALGGAGGVFDSQLYLMPDAGLAPRVADLLRTLSGTETVMAGDPGQGAYLRVLQHPRATAATAFLADHLLSPIAEIEAALETVSLGLTDPARELITVGHDIALSASYAARYGSVARFLAAVSEAVATLPRLAGETAPLKRGNAFAEGFGVAVPVMQGPMTRVSDDARFAAAVADGGALPSIAAAMMRPEQLKEVIQETKRLVNGRKWGVGFLGFLPQKLFRAQMDVVLAEKPDFAIIAGGRPDQAAQLEEIGVPTFLHLPSARLLDYYLKNGGRRLIFEGRECGGHIGPTSSFVLWSSMIDRICEEIDAGRVAGPDLDCIFAGGLHDALSSAFLQVMVAPLAARGVRLGMIVGTAYVLTEEITASGAIQPLFQETVRAGTDTAILASGPGHASRSMRTPFVDTFIDRQKALRGDAQMPEEDKREVLDEMIMGTLRIASKGTQRSSETGEIETVSDAEQVASGMYMIGQVASLRNDVRTIDALHASLTDEAVALLAGEAAAPRPAAPKSEARPLDIAIVGMSAALPGAMSKEAYWQNILGQVDSVDEIPRHRWDWRLYFDEDRKAKDKIYSRWGGFLDDMPFEPGDFGITPKSLLSVDPMQLMALKLADQALGDAGYTQMDKDLRDRTAVMIGASGGSGDVGLQYNLRSETPRFEGALDPALAGRLPEWSEDTFAGILINVISGRITNRLDLGGPNFTTDAACASSLAAVYQACNELRSGRSKMAIAGGVDTQQSPFGFMCFSQTQALSPRGRSRSFDKGADGIAISEGIVMLVLKPLEDAEAAGDRIYAVIKGVGSSSDGKGKALSAPEAAGQFRAMRRAYEQAGYTPADVQLFEAHGTGTVVGDSTELTSTGMLVAEGNPAPRSAVIGSVKTNIGHTKATAGIAGLAKIALALHHKVLPPHRGVDDPNDVLAAEDAPLYLLDAAEPWVTTGDTIRRASVSAFGFGGTNFHATLEEYQGEYRPAYLDIPTRDWPAELLMLSGADRAGLIAATEAALTAAQGAPALRPRYLAAALTAGFKGNDGARAALVVTDMADAVAQLGGLLAHLTEGAKLPPEAVLSEAAPETGKLAVLFPGQGSQYPFMGREAAVYMGECADVLSRANTALAGSLAVRYPNQGSLSAFLYPRGAYTEPARQAARTALTATDIAQPALGAVEAGLWAFLSQRLGLTGDMFAGHSYGEFVAHHAAGVLSLEDLMAVSEARGRLIVEKAAEGGSELGTMLAVSATRADAEALVTAVTEQGVAGLVVANHNSPSQVILSGPEAAVAAAEKLAEARETRVTRLPVAAAFHSALMAPARDALGEVIDTLDWDIDAAARVYSNASAAPHGADVRAAMTDHLVRPVNFVDQLKAMHADGARVFVEVGPKSVLSRLVTQSLGTEGVTSIATDGADGSLASLLAAIGALAVNGQPLALERLYDGRDCAGTPLKALDALGQPLAPSKRGWWINGSGVRRARDPQKTVGLTEEEAASALQAPAAQSPSSGETPPAASVAPAPGFAPAPVPGDPMPVMDPMPFQSPPISSSKRGTRMYNAPFRPSPDGSGGTVSSEFFSLMARIVESAEAVACADLGAQPVNGGPRGGHKQIRLRPAPQPQAVEAAIVAPLAAPAAAPAPVAAAVAAPVAAAPVAASAPAPAPVPAPAPAPAPALAPAPVVAEAAPAPAPAAQVDLKATLLAIVADKTGYDEDILEMDANIEADLGIDSIKRVDIVAGLVEKLPVPVTEKLDDSARAALNGAKTLDGMLEVLTKAEATANFNVAGAETGSDQQGAPTAPEADALPRPDRTRFVMAPRPEPLPADLRSQLTEGRFLIVPSGGALDETLATALTAAGQQVEILPAAARASEAALLAWLDTHKTDLGALAGVVNLAALEAGPLDLAAGPEAWRAALFTSEKVGYLLLRDLDFLPEAHAVSVTGLGGLFARGSAGKTTGAAPLSLQGGAVGMLKSLLREDEARRCKAIDLDPALDAKVQAEIVFAEMAARGGRVEVGYPAGTRTVFRSEIAPVATETREAEANGEVILATGGARGITAETIRELGAPGVTFILTGRSALPQPEEALRDDPALADLGEVALAKHFTKVEKLPIAKARRRAAKVMAAREMGDCLAALRATGATVEYLSVDVNDAAAVKAAIEGIYARHGRLDGIVHGAGVIEDKLLRDIPSDSWDRVVETKVLGMLALMAAVQPEGLKFFYTFTSVAGRYGNAGQSSYATANELMARLASQWQAVLGPETRVKAMNWGPWGPTTFGSGMVTPETERKFRAQGVYLVHARLGADLFRMETRASLPDAAVEVIYGAAPWEQAEAGRSALICDGPAGLLGAAEAEAGAGGKQVLSLNVDTTMPYLRDHIIKGNPVLPMAVAMEMMAEAVERTFGGDLRIVAIEEARLFHGLVLKENSPHGLQAVMTQNSHGMETEESVTVKLFSADNPKRPHYAARFVLARDFAPAPSPAALVPEAGAREITLAEAYDAHLFHGPAFHAVLHADAVWPGGAMVRTRGAAPAELLGDAGGPDWVFDPFVIDGIAQLPLLWAHALTERFTLPIRFDRIERFAGSLDGADRIAFRILEDRPDLIVAEAHLLDAQGQVLLAVSGMTHGVL